MIENTDLEELNEVIRFCLSVGLPITLEEFGVCPTEENIRKIAQFSSEENWKREPFLVTEVLIVGGITQANESVKLLKK